MAVITTFHWVDYDVPGRRTARAICGQLVDRYREHHNEPNCPSCQRILAARRTDDERSVEDLFGGPPEHPVHSTLFDPHAAFTRKSR